MSNRPAASTRDFFSDRRVQRRAWGAFRDAALRTAALFRPRPKNARFLRFPVYHHVFDRERERFAAHLRFYRNHGEFISIDDALDCLESPGKPDGAYYCLTFDDGFRNCITNAMPLLLEHRATAAFFLATAYVDGTLGQGPHPRYWLDVPKGVFLEFLTWKDCRTMVAAGMTIGSHTRSHAHLTDISEAEAEQEMRASKQAIERETGAPCRHFSCPWGLPVVDFDPGRAPAIAERVGYRSFFTGVRGNNAAKPAPFAIPRDPLAADAGLHELRYFFYR